MGLLVEILGVSELGDLENLEFELGFGGWCSCPTVRRSSVVHLGVFGFVSCSCSCSSAAGDVRSLALTRVVRTQRTDSWTTSAGEEGGVVVRFLVLSPFVNPLMQRGGGGADSCCRLSGERRERRTLVGIFRGCPACLVRNSLVRLL